MLLPFDFEVRCVPTGGISERLTTNGRKICPNVVAEMTWLIV